MPLVAVAFVSASARNIVGPLWLKTVTRGLFLRHFVPPRRAARFPRSLRSLGMTNFLGVCGVLIMFIRFNPKRTPVPPCHCERRRSHSVAISWKRNAAHVHAPAYSPVAARHRGNLPEGKTYFRTRLPKYLTARIPDLTKKRHATFCSNLLVRVCAILC